MTMNPVERLVVWIWDPTGDRRRQQQHRRRRTERKIEHLDSVTRRAVDRIRRLQAIAAKVDGDELD